MGSSNKLPSAPAAMLTGVQTAHDICSYRPAINLTSGSAASYVTQMSSICHLIGYYAPHDWMLIH